MTSGLRKAHRYIWLVLFIAIPIMIVFATKNLSFSGPNSEQSSTTTFTEKSTKAAFENELVKVALYPTNVELILKRPLKNASCIVYAIDKNDVKTAIGQLTTPGKYQFKVTDLPENILIYDEIKDVLITKTNL